MTQFISAADRDRQLRRVVCEIARRIGIQSPHRLHKQARLLPVMAALDAELVRNMEAYRTSFRLCYDAMLALRRAARAGRSTKGLLTVAMRRMEERDMHSAWLTFDLDGRYPNWAA